MPSTSKCEYCGSTITSNDSKCPNCAASNPLYVIDTQKIVTDPKTIEELQEYCAERGMPLQRMRFFIGVDFKEPKAFGIYKDEKGVVTVYKNKADGTRAVRYQGTDEARGVAEIFLKLLDECHNRGIYPDGGRDVSQAEQDIKRNTRAASRSAGASSSIKDKISDSRNNLILIGAIVIVGIFIVFAIVNSYKHPDGYYKYDGNLFYYKSSDWYYYDDYYSDWYAVEGYDTSELYDSSREYYQGDDSRWATDWGAYDFENSQAYSDYVESHNSDSDSSYDSWDSGSTDWDSDW